MVEKLVIDELRVSILGDNIHWLARSLSALRWTTFAFKFAAIIFRIVSMRCWKVFDTIPALSVCVRFDDWVSICRMVLSISSHKFSTGLRSGDCEGQSLLHVPDTITVAWSTECSYLHLTTLSSRWDELDQLFRCPTRRAQITPGKHAPNHCHQQDPTGKWFIVTLLPMSDCRILFLNSDHYGFRTSLQLPYPI